MPTFAAHALTMCPGIMATSAAASSQAPRSSATLPSITAGMTHRGKSRPTFPFNHQGRSSHGLRPLFCRPWSPTWPVMVIVNPTVELPATPSRRFGVRTGRSLFCSWLEKHGGFGGVDIRADPAESAVPTNKIIARSEAKHKKRSTPLNALSNRQYHHGATHKWPPLLQLPGISVGPASQLPIIPQVPLDNHNHRLIPYFHAPPGQHGR